MVVVVTRRNFVAVRNKELVASGRIMMVSGLYENRIPMRSSCHVGARYSLAVTAGFLVLAACGRVRPTATGLVGIALDEKADQQGCAEDCDGC